MIYDGIAAGHTDCLSIYLSVALASG